MDKRQYIIDENRDFKNYIKVFGYTAHSMVDYPDYNSSVFHLKYCNMDCWFCHNKKAMVENAAFSKESLMQALEMATYTKFTQAIVITGGEPTLYGKDLLLMCDYIKSTCNKKIKVDTNGTNPDVIEILIKEKLVDFIAMDIKMSFDNYGILGFNGKKEDLLKSVELIKTINHQYRHTAIPTINQKDLDFLQYFPDLTVQEYKNLT